MYSISSSSSSLKLSFSIFIFVFLLILLLSLFNDDDDEEIEEDYNKLKDKQAVFFKIIHDENYNSIDIKENNNIETSTINQGENTNINSIILNFRNNKSTIESEQFGTLNINRPRLIGISENSNEDNKSINDNI